MEKSETEINVVELDTVHGHKYSSPSIFYYIFHIKPLFFSKKYFKVNLWADFYEIYFKTRIILEFYLFI